jgi:uncharacterized protein (TIGR03067 family)
MILARPRRPSMLRIFPLFAMLCLAFAPAPLPKARPDDMKLLQGGWQMVSEMMELVGRRGNPAWLRHGGPPMKIEGKRMVTSLDYLGTAGEFTLDSKTTPKRIGLKFTSYDGRRVQIDGTYKIEDDTLSITWDFVNQPGAVTEVSHHLVYRRKKP